MTPEYTNPMAAGLLISGLLSGLALALLACFVTVVCGRQRHARWRAQAGLNGELCTPQYQPSILEHTCRWLAVRSTHLSAVQSALGLHNATPCSWGEGMSRLNARQLFVSPPIRGWILVVGQGLPDPSDDIDRCFHFLTRLSRKLGEIQFFSANRPVNHHAWVRMELGQVRRGYAWAGETLWNQGEPSQAELDLGMRCYGYGESAYLVDLSSSLEQATPNCEKLFSLASRWSFDPSTVNERTLLAGLVGVAGEVSR